jgi:hypothetical protein
MRVEVEMIPEILALFLQLLQLQTQALVAEAVVTHTTELQVVLELLLFATPHT